MPHLRLLQGIHKSREAGRSSEVRRLQQEKQVHKEVINMEVASGPGSASQKILKLWLEKVQT